jgi:Mg2+ and Co2+ transporter CorA
MQGIFQKENTDKALKYGIYRHLPTYEKIIRNLVSFYAKKKNKSKKNILLTLIGYAMIMIFCIKSLYEINTKPFVSLNFLELVISIIYIACAILLFSREIKN